jgi:predicted enzyme related to lactoylglutathione lyase
MSHAISWFEIPSADIQRATQFYETIFATQLFPMDMGELLMRVFPVEDMNTEISGAIVHGGDFHKPSSSDGVLIYLNANGRMDEILGKVPEAGGEVMVPKTQISPEHGYMAVILDSEGNRIGLHSA